MRKTTLHLFSLVYLVLLLSCLFSCGTPAVPVEEQKAVAQPEATATPQIPVVSAEQLELNTFEVKDESSGKSLGWGYDILVNGQRMIHQPIIPAIPGNNSFRSEQEARTTGNYAISKMKTSGTLPTISVKELDSLGITKP